MRHVNLQSSFHPGLVYTGLCKLFRPAEELWTLISTCRWNRKWLLLYRRTRWKGGEKTATSQTDRRLIDDDVITQGRNCFSLFFPPLISGCRQKLFHSKMRCFLPPSTHAPPLLSLVSKASTFSLFFPFPRCVYIPPCTNLFF
jgi:hypothetical protein